MPTRSPRFYDHTRARVYGLVARVLRDSGYSEETTQEVYLEVWRTAEAYDSAKGSALSWLMTMAHRRAVDRVRAEQAATQRESRYGAIAVDPPGDVVAESALAADEPRRVAECLAGLTDIQRQCIELAYYGGLTYAEVSQQLSANLSTIKSRMRDATARAAQLPGCAMTEPTDFELLELATPYALHAISDAERTAIDRQLAAAPPSVAAAFRDEVRAVRETMTAVSAATAAEPPSRLRAAVLAAVPRDGGVDLVGAQRYWLRPRQSLWDWPPSAPESRCDRRPHRQSPTRSWRHRMCERSLASWPAGRRRWCSRGTRTPVCW